MTVPRAPSGGSARPFSSKATPPALPIVSTNGWLETHSRTSPAGIVSSVIRPSAILTRTHVDSDTRAMSRYGDDTAPTTLGRFVGPGLGADDNGGGAELPSFGGGGAADGTAAGGLPDGAPVAGGGIGFGAAGATVGVTVGTATGGGGAVAEAAGTWAAVGAAGAGGFAGLGAAGAGST